MKNVKLIILFSSLMAATSHSAYGMMEDFTDPKGSVCESPRSSSQMQSYTQKQALDKEAAESAIYEQFINYLRSRSYQKIVKLHNELVEKGETLSTELYTKIKPFYAMAEVIGLNSQPREALTCKNPIELLMETESTENKFIGCLLSLPFYSTQATFIENWPSLQKSPLIPQDLRAFNLLKTSLYHSFPEILAYTQLTVGKTSQQLSVELLCMRAIDANEKGSPIRNELYDLVGQLMESKSAQAHFIGCLLAGVCIYNEKVFIDNWPRVKNFPLEATSQEKEFLDFVLPRLYAELPNMEDYKTLITRKDHDLSLLINNPPEESVCIERAKQLYARYKKLKASIFRSDYQMREMELICIDGPVYLLLANQIEQLTEWMNELKNDMLLIFQDNSRTQARTGARTAYLNFDVLKQLYTWIRQEDQMTELSATSKEHPELGSTSDPLLLQQMAEIEQKFIKPLWKHAEKNNTSLMQYYHNHRYLQEISTLLEGVESRQREGAVYFKELPDEEKFRLVDRLLLMEYEENSEFSEQFPELVGIIKTASAEEIQTYIGQLSKQEASLAKFKAYADKIIQGYPQEKRLEVSLSIIEKDVVFGYAHRFEKEDLDMNNYPALKNIYPYAQDLAAKLTNEVAPDPHHE